MNPNIEKKLSQIQQQHQMLSTQMSDPDIVNDQQKFMTVSKSYHQIQPLVEAYDRWCVLKQQLEDIDEMIAADDDEMKALAESERQAVLDEQEDIYQTCLKLLIPKDPDDNKSVFLEIRAGAGGAEAALFVADLTRMYQMYADDVRWRVEVMDQRPSEQGGFREIILSIKGEHVYRDLKYESGTHRVQRVPETESQGRIHTSTVTVAVLPQVDSVDHVDIQPQDLKIDTFRASGAGGQHVNTTDSAVRVTHIPSGVVVECQDERSQHKNKAKAMAILQARVLAQEREKQQAEETSLRRSLVGRGDRSERIRTYNFPQSRLTDHRVNLTLYQLESIMQGQMQPVISCLQQEDEASRLAGLVDDDS